MNAPPEQASVGFLLKERRQQVGLSLRDVAQRTCVRRTYLEALEADRFDLLPGEVYARGFVRIYAELLGLEAAPLLDELRRPEAEGPDETVLEKRGGSATVFRWALLALIVFVGLAGALLVKQWHSFAQAERTPAEAVVQEEPAIVMENAEPFAVDDAPATDPGDVPPPESPSVGLR